jgi:hypothetical protein
MKAEKEIQVPDSLRFWFVIHFIADIIAAIPLLLIPEKVLPLFGWQMVDPITTRLVGAALMGIGIESLLGRNASIDAFRAMLNLKIIWASSAVVALGLGTFISGIVAGWIIMIVFIVFLGIWTYYRILLR